MLRFFLHNPKRPGPKEMFLPSKRACHPNPTQHPIESLERRVYLSLAVPIAYSVGTQDYPGGNGFGSQVVTGDFNGDGKLDMAVTSPADNTVNILKGNGNGTFQPAVSYAAGVS